MDLDEKRFYNFFRMSVSTFEGLLQSLEPHIRKQYTNMRNPVEPIEMMGITLRYVMKIFYFFHLLYSRVKYKWCNTHDFVLYIIIDFQIKFRAILSLTSLQNHIQSLRYFETLQNLDLEIEIHQNLSLLNCSDP